MTFNERYTKAEKVLLQNQSMGRCMLAKQIGIPESQARSLVEKFRREQKKSGKAPSNGGLKFRHAQNIEGFRRQFDVPLKISEALEALGENVISDNDFRTELAVPAQSWAIARGRDEFTKNQVKIHGKIYWAQSQHIKSIRDTIDIL